MIKKAGIDGDGWVNYEEVLKIMKSEYVYVLILLFVVKDFWGLDSGLLNPPLNTDQ